MEAIIRNIQHHPARTPGQIIRSFLDTYTPKDVSILLWEIFRLAAKGGLGEKDGALPAEEVALLFDQLMDLSAAMEQESRATPIHATAGEEGSHD